MAPEKRVDPEDGSAYTYDELAAFYKGKYKKAAIAEYWETCKPVKKSKGAGKGSAPEPKSKAKAKAKVKAKAKAKPERKPKEVTFCYHKTHGLAAPLRMMLYYRAQDFNEIAFGTDLMEQWGQMKPKMAEKNACINLPWVQVGDTLVTQSNTCLLFLGRVLGIDRQSNFFHNHCVLDQVMDLRNDLMQLVYPPGVATGRTLKEEFPEAAKKHLEGTAKTNLTKLEGFCKGPYMCGKEMQSGDFHVFEMVDQHKKIALDVGEADPVESLPKLQALHTAFKAETKLQKYFDSDCYKDYPLNNPNFTGYTGKGADFYGADEWGTTVERKVSFK